MPTNTTTPRTHVPTWDVPAVHIERPASVPTSAEVKASFDPNDRMASEITQLAALHPWRDQLPRSLLHETTQTQSEGSHA